VCHDAAHQHDQRGLAAATRADHGERFTLCDLEIDVVEGNDAAAVEVATDMFEGNQR
jgi:hypothetical protein